MIYSVTGRSREADIVIWDEFNYPKLKLIGSNIFFYEGINTIIEVKSRWSNNEFNDIKKKTKALIEMTGRYRQSLSERIENIETELWSLETGNEWSGKLISLRKKGTIAIIFKGGQKFDIEDLKKNEIKKIDDEYPDIMLFLEAGKLVLKKYITDENHDYGQLKQIKCGNNALLMFTSSLINLLAKKSEHVAPPLFLTDYMFDLDDKVESKEIKFNLIRPIAGNSKTFWEN